MFEQTRHIARVARIFIDRSRKLAFFHFAFDNFLAARALHNHGHAINRRAIRQRKGVDRFDRAWVRIRIDLLNDGAREWPSDLDGNISVLQWAWTHDRAISIKRNEFAAFSNLRHATCREG